LVPYIYYTKCTKEEIIKSIDLLEEAGLIRLTSSVFPNETRYKLSDESLHWLSCIIGLIHRCQYEMIITKISYIEKPDIDDIDFLMFLFGKKDSERIIALAHESRKGFQKNYDRNKVEDIEKNIKVLQYLHKYISNYLVEQYGKVLKDNKLLSDLFNSNRITLE
jgi:hypothetical protein